MDQFLFRCGEMFGVLGTSGASISRYQIHQPVMYNPQYSTRSFSLLTFLIGGDRGGPNPFPVRRNVWGVGDQWGQQISRNQIHQPASVIHNIIHVVFSLTFSLIGGDWGGPNPFPVRRNVWGGRDQWGQQISRIKSTNLLITRWKL